MSFLWWIIQTIFVLLVAALGYIYWNAYRVTYCKSKRRLPGCTAVITGSNTGLGRETALDFARRDARVILACRNTEKAEAVAKEIVEAVGTKNRVKVMKLDLSSFKSVHEFVEKFNKEENRLDILVNNAGLLCSSERKLSEDGIELTMAANHFGHFLLTNLLLDKLKASAPSRVVNVSSFGHTLSSGLPFDDLNMEKSYSPFPAYYNSKLANILFTRELAKRLEGTGVTTYAVHPGMVSTELYRSTFSVAGLLDRFVKATSLTPYQGAQTQIYCSVAEELKDATGKYYANCAEKGPSSAAKDDAAARRLWDISVNLTGLKCEQ